MLTECLLSRMVQELDSQQVSVMVGPAGSTQPRSLQKLCYNVLQRICAENQTDSMDVLEEIDVGSMPVEDETRSDGVAVVVELEIGSMPVQEEVDVDSMVADEEPEADSMPVEEEIENSVVVEETEAERMTVEESGTSHVATCAEGLDGDTSQSLPEGQQTPKQVPPLQTDTAEWFKGTVKRRKSLSQFDGDFLVQLDADKLRASQQLDAQRLRASQELQERTQTPDDVENAEPLVPGGDARALEDTETPADAAEAVADEDLEIDDRAGVVACIHVLGLNTALRVKRHSRMYTSKASSSVKARLQWSALANVGRTPTRVLPRCQRERTSTLANRLGYLTFKSNLKTCLRPAACSQVAIKTIDKLKIYSDDLEDLGR